MGTWKFCRRVLGRLCCIRGDEDEFATRMELSGDPKRANHLSKKVEILDNGYGRGNCPACGDPNCRAYNMSLPNHSGGKQGIQAENEAMVAPRNNSSTDSPPVGLTPPDKFRATKCFSAVLAMTANNFINTAIASDGLISSEDTVEFNTTSGPPDVLTSLISDPRNENRELPTARDVGGDLHALGVHKEMIVDTPNLHKEGASTFSSTNCFETFAVDEPRQQTLRSSTLLPDAAESINDANNDEPVTSAKHSLHIQSSQEVRGDEPQIFLVCDDCSVKIQVLFGSYGNADDESDRAVYAQLLFHGGRTYLQTLGLMGKFQQGNSAPKRSAMVQRGVKPATVAALGHCLLNSPEDLRSSEPDVDCYGLVRKPHDYRGLSEVINARGHLQVDIPATIPEAAEHFDMDCDDNV